MRRGSLVSFACLSLLSARLAVAQTGSSVPKVTPGWSTDQFRGADDLIELTLDRALGARETLAVLVGATDVTALVDIRGTRVRYRPNRSLFRKSESEIVVYLVRDTAWTEIAKLPIKVRNRLGLDQGTVTPTADLSSAGQIKEGGNQAPQSTRDMYQDLSLRLGAASLMTRAPWQFELSTNALAVSNEQQRLRYGDKGTDALPIDLSDYRAQFSRGNNTLFAGNLRREDHKHLLRGFSSRGVGGAVQLGSLASIDAAVMNGTNVVGLENLLGIERSAHRISAAKLSMELVPKKPGALHVTVSGMDGSVLPRQNYNQSSVTDAEQSTGWGSQLDVSAPGDRVAISGGIAQSRFRNPVDPLLAGDSTIVAVRPESRMARFGEVRMQLLQEYRVTDSLGVDLALNARHERIDPMYRSVGASMQSDMQTNGGDLTARIGSLTLAAQYSSGRDNLANIASILTSRTVTDGLTAALPLASVFGKPGDWYLPTLGYGRQGTHQYGEGTPTNGEFSASDIPDQVSTQQNVSVDWSRESNTLSYRWNHSLQDDRQPGREMADITGNVHSVSLGMMPKPSLTITLELSRERQHFDENDAKQGLNRIGTIARWQINQRTDVSGNVSHSTTVPGEGESKRTNMEMQFEASRAFSIVKRADGSAPARIFLRFRRSLQSENPQFSGAISSRSIRWTLYAGGSVRLF